MREEKEQSKDHETPCEDKTNDTTTGDDFADYFVNERKPTKDSAVTKIRDSEPDEPTGYAGPLIKPKD